MLETLDTPHRSQYAAMTTERLRAGFLIHDLFRPGVVQAYRTEMDRAIVGSAVPVGSCLRLSAVAFDQPPGERRELGIVNLGAPGAVIVDGTHSALRSHDMLYVGRGSGDVKCVSTNASTPARFYWLSYPAQDDHPCVLVRGDEAERVALGSSQEANRRTIHKYIHPGRVASSQIVMGITRLEEGSVWNTMPPHTHPRRSEVYLYCDMDEDAVVFHFLGTAGQTRHVVVRNLQAVLSPRWSMHCGVGTSSYSFVWAMAGENQEFGDVDPIALKELL
jgi:4-deoxy-L-threo-5-hexosulose-uronate ketol-isomerase